MFSSQELFIVHLVSFWPFAFNVQPVNSGGFYVSHSKKNAVFQKLSQKCPFQKAHSSQLALSGTYAHSGNVTHRDFLRVRWNHLAHATWFPGWASGRTPFSSRVSNTSPATAVPTPVLSRCMGLEYLCVLRMRSVILY